MLTVIIFVYLEPGLLECLYHLLLVHIKGQVANVGGVGRSVGYPLILDARPQSSPGENPESAPKALLSEQSGSDEF